MMVVNRAILATFSMRRLSLVLATLAAVLVVQIPARADDLLLDRFRDYLEGLRAQSGIPGLAVSVVGYGSSPWQIALGKQDLERSVAARADTPFEFDGITQIFTAALVLRCAEEGQLALDDPIGKYAPASVNAGLTVRQALSHTSSDLVFRYRLDRVEALAPVVAACTGNPFVETVARRLGYYAMRDTVPGLDAVQLSPSSNVATSTIGTYRAVLARLATPYSVDSRGSATLSRYAATALTPASGLVSTVQDMATFMVDLRNNGLVVSTASLAMAWRPTVGANGQPLPHGLGWFVQSYNGETIVWQFGVSQGASSSLIVTVPGRGLSLILAANSDGLSAPFSLASGDLTVSPFGRLILGLFVR
jgi:CubicO group peptidase (beta-lactamase class C family)